MKFPSCFFLLFGFCHLSVFSQEAVKAVVLDSISQQPVPFATISVSSNFGAVSNEYGEFQLNLTETKGILLTIQCMGYESKSVSAEDLSSTVLLSPKSIELKEVWVLNKEYTAEEVVEKIKENLRKNYPANLTTKNTFFSRTSFDTKVLKHDFKVKKTSIPELNQRFVDSVMNVIPKQNDHHIEILGNFYADENTEKLAIIKASRLYDKEKEISTKNFEKRLKEIAQKHIKRDSYFKIKSGWIGGKADLDSAFFDDEELRQSEALTEAQKEVEEKRKTAFLKNNKREISRLVKDDFLSKDSKLNFIQKSGKYEFEMEDYTFLNDDFVCKLTFTPKNKADFEGVIYVNTSDFAILRVDYKNVQSLRKVKLLGVSYNQYLKSGTLIYSQNEEGNYLLRYAESKEGSKIGMDRPLMIIEKNKQTKGRRKQNELDADIHLVLVDETKQELVVFDAQQISKSEFENFKENPQVAPVYLPKYDPDFWKDYNIIEPNQAIRNFKIIE